VIRFVISGLIVASGFNDFSLALFSGAVISALTYYAFLKKLKLENLKAEKKSTPFKRLRYEESALVHWLLYRCF